MGEFIVLGSGLVTICNDVYLTSNPFSLLKQQSLIFDRIGILGLDYYMNLPYSDYEGLQVAQESLRRNLQSESLKNTASAKKKELEWLKENNLIFDVSLKKQTGEINWNDFGDYIYRLNKVGSVTDLITSYEKINREEELLHQKLIEVMSDLRVETDKSPSDDAMNSFLAQLIREFPVASKELNEEFFRTEARKRIEKILEDVSKGNLEFNEITRKCEQLFGSQMAQELSRKLSEQRSLISKRDELIDRNWKVLLLNDSMNLRFSCILQEFMRKSTVTPLLSYYEFLPEYPNTTKTEAIQIIIRKFPLPSSNTDWKKILEYKNDPSTKNNLLLLRKWIRKITSEDLPPNEIEDELEWLISEFERHMRLHEMKANLETLESIVKAPLEILEDLVRFRFSKIPDPFFSLAKRKISLMEAEINSPGREIAYLLKTKQIFMDD